MSGQSQFPGYPLLTNCIPGFHLGSAGIEACETVCITYNSNLERHAQSKLAYQDVYRRPDARYQHWALYFAYR